jgi:DNA-binding NarL/FixJ family response regulator
MEEPVLVGVVATDPVLEAGVTYAMAGCPELTVATGADEPEVTVVIVDRFDQDALDRVQLIRAAAHRPEVVLVAPDLVPADALRVIAAGARGLLRRREATGERLARAVLAAAGGDCTVSPDMLDRLLSDTEGRPGPTAFASTGVSILGDRERAVLALLADGWETREIARKLCYSTRTVTSVVHDITQRFRLRNRAHAVAYAIRAGLL